MNEKGGLINAIIAIIVLVVIVTILLNPLYSLVEVLTQNNNAQDGVQRYGTNPTTGAIEVVSTGVVFSDQAEWIFLAVGLAITFMVVLYLIKFAPTPAVEQQQYYEQQPQWRRYR